MLYAACCCRFGCCSCFQCAGTSSGRPHGSPAFVMISWQRRLLPSWSSPQVGPGPHRQRDTLRARDRETHRETHARQRQRQPRPAQLTVWALTVWALPVCSAIPVCSALLALLCSALCAWCACLLCSTCCDCRVLGVGCVFISLRCGPALAACGGDAPREPRDDIGHLVGDRRGNRAHLLLGLPTYYLSLGAGAGAGAREWSIARQI
jgi:hypothetical protein